VRRDLGAPALPVTVGVSGMGGYRPYSDTQCTGALDVLTDTIIPAQFAVANASLHPQFRGTVTAVETRQFHREARFSPGNQCYHWNNNCESYWRVGQAMGLSMLTLLTRAQAASTLVELRVPRDFVGSDGFPLPGGASDDASVTTNAPFGVAIRSGSPGKATLVAVEVPLTPGVTVESVSFSYRQCTGYGTTGIGPTFTLSIAGSPSF
jgi:hypothetical protein